MPKGIDPEILGLVVLFGGLLAGATYALTKVAESWGEQVESPLPPVPVLSPPLVSRGR